MFRVAFIGGQPSIMQKKFQIRPDRSLSILLVGFVFSAGMASAAQLHRFDAVTALMGELMRELRLDGTSLLLVRPEGVVYEHYFGSFTAETDVWIASASKWLSAATILTLVDDGLLTLDAPVSVLLPTWTGEHGTITMRQLLSHTHGLPTYGGAIYDRSITLEACAETILALPLRRSPGTDFAYGDTGFQLAGRMAEVAAGRAWNDIFAERIAGPLGMAHTTYTDTRNPNLARGAYSRLRDYGNFLRMLLLQGVWENRQILSAAAVAELGRDQTMGLPLAATIHTDERRYGLGCWRDLVAANGDAIQLSSPGVSGVWPWIDLQRKVGGVFLVQRSFYDVNTGVERIMAAVRDIMDGNLGAPSLLRAE